MKQNDENQHKAITFIRDHPATEVRLWFSRLRFGFGNDADGLRAIESYEDDRFLPDWLRTTITVTANLWFAVVGLLALGSLPWWLRRRDPGAWLIASAAVGVGVLPIVAFFGDPRFHVPMAPFLAILAAGVVTGWAWRPRSAAQWPDRCSGAVEGPNYARPDGDRSGLHSRARSPGADGAPMTTAEPRAGAMRHGRHARVQRGGDASSGSRARARCHLDARS